MSTALYLRLADSAEQYVLIDEGLNDITNARIEPFEGVMAELR